MERPMSRDEVVDCVNEMTSERAKKDREDKRLKS